MKCGSVLILLVLAIVVPPGFAEEPVGDAQTQEIQRVDPGSPYLLPAVPYTVSPFEETTTTNSIGEILGSRTGYIHPYIGIGEYYTDNLFRVDSGKQGEFYTRITPGVWVALPASKYPIRQLRTLNTAPGGLALSRFRIRGKSRIEAYGGYQLDILEHHRFSSEDHLNQRGEGFFRYNFRGGLFFELSDIYELNHDAYNTGDSDALQKFTSNLFNTAIGYEISPKTRVEGEYGFYTLSYASEERQFRDRDDHSFALRGFYRFLPKTSAILEYNYINLDYDEDVLSDSDEHRVFLGADWEQSGKSRWRILVGVGEKDYDDPGHNTPTQFLGEIQFRHRFTPKTFAQLQAGRSINETDSLGTDYTISHRVQLRYFQRLTARFLASANLFYENIDYHGEDREDDRGRVGFDVKYTLTNWLAVSGGYAFEIRDSSSPDSDYEINNVYLNMIFSL